MRALTPEIWEYHHTDLADRVVERWPALTREQVEATAGDFDALAAVVAGVDGGTVDEARRELLRVEVDERMVGSSDPGMTVAETPGQASVARLRLGTGFTEADRSRVVDALEKLDRRLEHFPADATELEIHVKNRDDTDQSVTLEAWLPNLPHMVATSTAEDLRNALVEVREALWRQIDDALGKRRPYD
jgi:ribosome-associated translation inhibitor RaiA